MLRFVGKMPKRDAMNAGVFADHKTKAISFEFDRVLEGVGTDLSTFKCFLHIDKLGFIELPISKVDAKTIRAKMVVTNGITNYPGLHRCSFKFMKDDMTWGTENFFLRVFEGQDSSEELTDDPP